jgi:hypothetical protein
MRRIAAVVLLVVGPLAFAVEVQLALARLLMFGLPALLLLAARIAVVALGVAAGRLLWSGDVVGWRLARVWSVAAALLLALTFATPYFPSNRTPSEKRVTLVVWLLVYAAWFVVSTWRARTDETDGHS